MTVYSIGKLLLAVLIFLIVQTSGSKLVFTSNPQTVQPSLTKSLNLTCGLEDTNVGGLVGKRQLSNTSNDVAQVTSILVTRGGQDVASVTPYTPATSMAVGMSNLQVTGDVTGSTGALNLTWAFPTQQQLGDFECEVHAIMSDGHHVVFSSTTHVDAGQTTLEDLKNIITLMEGRLNQQEIDTAAWRNRTVVLEKELVNQKIQQQNETAALEAELKKKEQEILAACTGDATHTESGHIDCGDSTKGGWHDIVEPFAGNTGFLKSKSVTVPFKVPYKNKPVVQLGLTTVFVTHSLNDLFGVELLDVNEHSFTMRCLIFKGYQSYTLQANWMSVTQ